MEINYSGMVDNIYAGNNNIYMGHNMTSHDNMLYDYIIDNVDNSAVICNYGNNENVNEIRKIRNNITNIFNCDPSELNASFNNSVNASDTELLNEFNDYLDNFIKGYLKEQDNYLKCENNLINEKNESKTIIKKLDIVIDFMRELSEEDCDDGINSTIIENIKQYSKQKENGDRLVIAKNEYYNSRLKINKYLEVIKKINSVNTTNTCPTCMSNAVSIYLNPCGHTMCGECYDRLTNNGDRKCFLCRARVLSKFPLYFS
jgi:hypothetical protein